MNKRRLKRNIEEDDHDFVYEDDKQSEDINMDQFEFKKKKKSINKQEIKQKELIQKNNPEQNLKKTPQSKEKISTEKKNIQPQPQTKLTSTNPPSINLKKQSSLDQFLKSKVTVNQTQNQNNNNKNTQKSQNQIEQEQDEIKQQKELLQYYEKQKKQKEEQELQRQIEEYEYLEQNYKKKQQQGHNDKKNETIKKNITPQKKNITPEKNKTLKKNETPEKNKTLNKNETPQKQDTVKKEQIMKNESKTQINPKNVIPQKEQKNKEQKQKIEQEYDQMEEEEKIDKKQIKKGGSYGNWKKSDKQKDIIDNEEISEKPLTGFTIVLTGNISLCSRDDLQIKLIQYGAKVTGSVSGNTTVLIAGDILEDGRTCDKGSKYKAAQAKGTLIIRENQLDQWLQDNVGKNIDEIFGESELLKLYKKYDDNKTDSKIIPPNQYKMTDFLYNNQLQWSDKYAPQIINDLIGNKNAASQLVKWLKGFGQQIPQEQKKKKFMMFQLQRFQITGEIDSKACLISGPPGIGKSSLVKIITEVLGYAVVNTNASIQRNQAHMKKFLHDLIDNQMFLNNKVQSKFVIVMDEVDGMTGSDRGGLQALVQQIKETKIPIICICNDIENPKLKTLMTYSYNIKMIQPPFEDIVKRLMVVCKNEKLNISENELLSICTVFGGDIRQILQYLQVQSFSKKKEKSLQSFQKDQVSVLNTFQAVSQLLNRQEREQLKFRQQMDLYFLDYDLIPLIIQDSYLQSITIKENKKPTKKTKTDQNKKKETKKKGKNNKDEIELEDDKADKNKEKQGYSLEQLEQMSKAATLIAEGDIINSCIRKKQQWALMPSYGFLSTLYPCDLVGEVVTQPKFPTFLGKNSTTRKIKRLSKELKIFIQPNTFNASINNVQFSYLKVLQKIIVANLKRGHEDDLEAVIRLMVNYHINPENLKEHFEDLMFNPMKLSAFVSIPAQIKSALTRKYHKRYQEVKNQKQKKEKSTNLEENYEKNTQYNPLMGEEAQIIDENEELRAIQDQDLVQEQPNINLSNDSTQQNIIISKQKGQKQTKQKKEKKEKQPQKQKTQKKQQSSESEHDSSMDEFINEQ